jgi:hypothetical protein
MDHHSQSRHIPGSHLASRTTQDDELLSQDSFSLCSNTTHSDASDLKPWALNDVDSVNSNSLASTKPDSPAVQMLSFSLSQHALLHSAVGASDIMYSAGSEYHGLPDVSQSDMDYAKAQDFNNHYTSLFDFSAFENDVNGTHSSCTPDRGSPVGDSQLADWSIASDNRYNQSMDHFAGVFHPMPVSPPLTEASHDLSVTSSCSHSGYPAFMSHEDAMLKDITTTTTTPVGPQGINLGDPIFPLTPPLNEQDPNR